MSRILIIDDEPAIARSLKPVLEATGHDVFCAELAVQGLRSVREDAIDLVLLDLGLPDTDGKEIISQMKDFGDVAVIVISARHQDVEKVAALDAGADDYVDKPFSVDELMARIRVGLRKREAPLRRHIIDAGAIQMNLNMRQATLLGDELKLSPKEYDLLAVLAQNAGQVVTHRRLLLAGWGDPKTENQYLRSYIALLRQKIEEDPAEPQLLLSEPGVGYRLVA